FNLDTIESSRVADVMANAINRSKLTIDKLRIAFNFVGAAASQSGLSIEELSASMMLLANNGLRASTIGTGLRQVLARLLAPNRRLREEFQAQGIALDKINPKTVGYQNAMKELTKVLYDAETQTVDMGKAYQLFGLRGAQAVSILVKGFAGTGFQNMLDKTYEVGTAASMAETQMEGLAVSFKNLVDRSKLLFVALGEGGLTTTMKVFVQILKLATIAIAAFLKSGIGQLIISFSALTGSFFLIIKGLSLLTKAMFTASAATMLLRKQMGFMRATTINLGTALANFSNPILLAAVAMGIIVAAINHYLGRTQRAIDATIKMSQTTFSNINALKVYGNAIESINKRKKEGQEVDKEYIAVLQRLIETYPDLKDKIELNTEAHEENARVIKEELGKELDKLIKQNTELLRLQDKSAKQARILAGVWKLVMKAIYTPVKWITDYFTKSVKVIDDMSKSSKKSVGYLEKLGVESKKAKEIEDGRLITLRQTVVAMEANNKSVATIIKTLEAMGATEPEIRKIKDAFKDQAITLKELEKRYSETRGKSINAFKDMYESLDVLRKADFMKAVKAMDDEIAAAKKKHAEITGGTKLGLDVIAAIRAKHLMKFTEDSYKEVLIEEEVSRKKIEALEHYMEKVDEIYKKRAEKADDLYLVEFLAAQGNKKKLLEAEEKYSQEMKAAAEDRNKSIEGIQKTHNENVKREQAKVVDAMRKLHKKMADDLIDQLTSKYEKLKTEVEKLMDDLRSLEQSYREDMKDSAQKTMTDEEKWADDKEEVYRLMNEARKNSDVELYEKARSLAKSLGREVVDENGKVISSLEETTRISEQLMTSSYEAQSELIKELAKERTKEMGIIQEDIKKINELLAEYEKAITRAGEKKLELDMQEAINSIGTAHGLVSKFKEKWDRLESKTITLTVITKNITVGGGGEGGGGEAPPTESRWGGLIKKFARGAKLPGWGGGDKIKALLEAGEWVIRKEAVQKYGSALFEALNSLSFNIEDMLGGVMKQMGGMIPQPVKYQSGGGVDTGRGKGIGNTYNITFAPQFMTGDEMAMRNMAPELKRILEDLDHRWGN
ncbi:MAG: phage tail tape measure protein, partial [Candidatus Heimdallarchaeota archaeon]